MNTPCRVLIVGVGSIGERHLRCFQSTGRVETAFCEANPELRQAIAERYAISSSFDSFEAALVSSPDLVVVATPAPLHGPMALAAVQAGADVLIEKPLSISQDGIEELAKVAQERKRIVGVAYVYRSHPSLEAMRSAIMTGRFGTPVEIVATCGQHFPYYRPAYRSIYYRDRNLGGGAVQDALTHIINAAEWLVGPVTQLVADLDHLVLEGVAVEDTVHLLARHGPVLACYSLNQHQAPNELTITVICERGTARFEAHQNRWRWQTDPAATWTEEPGEPLDRDALFIRQANDFLTAIEQRKAPRCTLQDGRQTLAVNLAILRSAEQKSWINVEEFLP